MVIATRRCRAKRARQVGAFPKTRVVWWDVAAYWLTAAAVAMVKALVGKSRATARRVGIRHGGRLHPERPGPAGSRVLRRENIDYIRHLHDRARNGLAGSVGTQAFLQSVDLRAQSFAAKFPR